MAGEFPLTAADAFAELEEASSLVPDYVGAYKALCGIFHRLLNHNTSYQTISFAGTFSQTDYLLQEHKAPSDVRRMVNDTRVRLRRFGDRLLSHDELRRNFTDDCCSLCLFVATIYGVKVPAELADKFPVHKPRATSKRLLGDSLRAMVQSWDDSFIYCHVDSSPTVVQRISYQSAYADEQEQLDWSYIKRLLYKNAQLSLVRPRESDGTIHAEYIILEPDYLVDVSAVAACFESYGTSSLLNLFNKLKPSAGTEATLLGNLASQLLDEEINCTDSMPSYGETATRFFQDNALSLLSVKLSTHFHDDARRQRQNIHRAFEELRQRQVVNAFRNDAVVLEPSFFCPTLGLQGRMDLLQLDFKLLMEQKSGKCAYPQPHTAQEPPRAMDKHYVQMLLYMLIIRYGFRREYERDGRELEAFLLYSKYEQSLCRMGFAPRLAHEAIKQRNAIVWRERNYARGGFDILDRLTPESVITGDKEQQARSRLWVDYVRPQLDSVLAPIRNASEVERAYFYRFLTFIANEQLLSKIGNKTKDDAGFASIWLSSLEDKLLAGNIYEGLTLASPSANHVGAVERVVLHFHERRENDMSNFRRGDIVILYPHKQGKTPDACSSMVVRCTIEELSSDTVTLLLRHTQSDARVFHHFDGLLWAIEHDYMEASYGTLYRGMHAFLSAPRERRQLLLGERKPNIDTTRRLKGDYGEFNELSLRVKQAEDLFLVIGPPGTGKTSYGMLNTLKEELLEPGTNTLLISFTNRAVDEMCDKLVEEGIDFVRLGRPSSTSSRLVPHLLDTKLSTCKNIDDVRQLILRTRVIAGTTTTFSSAQGLFEVKHFDLAIVDEASQILEPHLMPLLTAQRGGLAAIRKFVFIGDHKQLPAVVQQPRELSEVKEPSLRAIALTDCRLSLFERMLRLWGDDKSVAYMLKRQGRMHPDIAIFPNRAFYGGQLEIVPLEHQLRTLPKADDTRGIDCMISTRRIAFVNVEAPKAEDYVSDKVNTAEASIIADMAIHIYNRCGQAFRAESTLGIIVPYRNQIATIRNMIESRSSAKPLHDITIDTVERFQGSQRDFIIYGFTVQRRYQLEFLTNNTFEEAGHIIDRKLNVAMTRAREHLFMVGNARLLGTVKVFRQLLAFVKECDSYIQQPT